MNEEEFVTSLKQLIGSSASLTSEFLKTRNPCGDPNIKNEFTEVSVFSAKLFRYLLKHLKICDLNFIDDDDLYPEFTEDIGNSILLVLSDKGDSIFDHLKKCIDKFSIRYGAFVRYAMDIGDEKFESVPTVGMIYALQVATCWIIIMSLFRSPTSNLVAFGIPCWNEVFKLLYYEGFYRGKFWGRLPNEALSVAKEKLSLDVTELGWSSILQRVVFLGSKIYDYVHNKYSDVPLTPCRRPRPSMRDLWNEHGSEYINIHIFASELFKHLLKMCGFDPRYLSLESPKRHDDEKSYDEFLVDSVKNTARATLLMLLFRKDNAYLSQIFGEQLRTFHYNQSYHNYYWLYAQKSEEYFVKTSYLCLQVLQMTGFIFEMILKGSKCKLFVSGYEVWVKVFLYKYGRKYSQRGGWELFLRDALPVINEHSSEEVLKLVQNDDWSPVVELFQSIHEAAVFNWEYTEAERALLQTKRMSMDVEMIPSLKENSDTSEKQSPDGKGRTLKRPGTDRAEESNAETAKETDSSRSDQAMEGASTPKKSKMERRASLKSPVLSLDLSAQSKVTDVEMRSPVQKLESGDKIKMNFAPTRRLSYDVEQASKSLLELQLMKGFGSQSEEKVQSTSELQRVNEKPSEGQKDDKITSERRSPSKSPIRKEGSKGKSTDSEKVDSETIEPRRSPRKSRPKK